MIGRTKLRELADGQTPAAATLPGITVQMLAQIALHVGAYPGAHEQPQVSERKAHCKYCGAGPMNWGKQPGSDYWRLYKDAGDGQWELHDCPNHPNKTSAGTGAGVPNRNNSNQPKRRYENFDDMDDDIPF